jgi:hypothetical protein
MEYIGRVPAPPLDSLIDDLYCLTGHPPYRRMKVPPLPSAHLFVNLTGPIRLYGAEKAKELAGERTVTVNAGDVGGQVLAAGLFDEVAMDVVRVVFGSGKRWFGQVDGQHLLEDPHVVIQGDRVLHLRFKVRR